MKKNRLSALLLAVVTALALSAAAFASGPSSYTVTDKSMPGGSVPVSGKLPYLQCGENSTVADEVNRSVSDFYNDTIFAAKEPDRTLPVYFTYTATGDTQYLSLVMRAEVNAGNTSSQQVRAVTVGDKHPGLYTLPNLLGEGAYREATKAVRAQIAADPQNYFDESATTAKVGRTTPFYVNDKSEVVVVFDKYSIAPGVTGAPEFVVGTVAK